MDMTVETSAADDQFEFDIWALRNRAGVCTAGVVFKPTPYDSVDLAEVQFKTGGVDWWDAIFNALQLALVSAEWRVRQQLDAQEASLQRDGLLVDEGALRAAPDHLKPHVGVLTRRPDAPLNMEERRRDSAAMLADTLTADALDATAELLRVQPDSSPFRIVNDCPGMAVGTSYVIHVITINGRRTNVMVKALSYYGLVELAGFNPASSPKVFIQPPGCTHEVELRPGGCTTVAHSMKVRVEA